MGYASRYPITSRRAITVDGQPKGEAFKQRGRWWWRRPSGSIEPFARGSTIADVESWALKCCNGRVVTSKPTVDATGNKE